MIFLTVYDCPNDGRGRSWMIMIIENHSKPWTVMNDHERSWVIMDGNGRSWIVDSIMNGHERSLTVIDQHESAKFIFERNFKIE